jgi:hypothetical protein
VYRQAPCGDTRRQAVQRYANVDGQKQLPFPKGRGTCPCCGGLLIAKCGQINAHHWAHESRDDCDTWSESIGPWHLWWQNLVRPAFVEVVRGQHRADIAGNGGVVVELQHSFISAEEIAAREAFYGNMIWLFDATHRFAYTKSGEWAFFSLGQTKHLDLCKKPVFLDFGFDVVQVEWFTDAITMVSGFGRIRSREWFAEAFLSDVRKPGSAAGEPFIPEAGAKSPWDRKSPVWKLKHPTKWVVPGTGQTVTYPKWTEYIWLRYGTRTGTNQQDTQWDHDTLIDRFPDIANGWTKEGLRQMKDLLCGRAIILGGLLRVLPHSADAILVNRTVSATEHLLRFAEEHIQVGRLPVLKEKTKQSLIDKARQYEVKEFGRPLRQEPVRTTGGQRSLFE